MSPSALRTARSPSRAALVTAVTAFVVSPLGFAAGCAAPRAAAGRVDRPAVTASDAGAPSGGRAVRVQAATWPAELTIDGSLGEWAAPLDELATPSDEVLEAAYAQGAPSLAALETQLERGVRPSAAPSELRVALGPEGLAVAGRLAGPATGGVWLTVAADDQGYPAPGTYWQGSAWFLEEGCPEFEEELVDGAPTPSDRPLPPGEVAACRERLDTVLERVRRSRDAWARQLERSYFVTASGVQRLASDGSLAAVAGAVYAVREAADGLAVELRVPVDALPRMTEAPVVALRLAGAVDGPVLSPPADTTRMLAEPVSFGPQAPLREAVFAALGVPNQIPIVPARALSYHPAAPERLAFACPTSDDVVEREGPLSRPLGRLGDVSVSHVSVIRQFLAIERGGRLDRLEVPLDEGVSARCQEPWPAQAVTRAGELHVVTYTPEVHGGGSSFTPPGWAVTAVAPDGSSRSALPDAFPPMFTAFCQGWERFVDPALTELGFRGECSPGGRVEVRFRWGPAVSAYELVSAPR